MRRCVGEALGLEPAALEPIGDSLGTRSFLRVRLPDGRSLIARVDGPEDPHGRPAGVAPEPPLEPIRAFLAAAGLPVPARLGGAEGIALLEDFGARSLQQAACEVSADERGQLYAEACDLVPRLQALVDPGDLAAFRRRLDASQLAYKADLFTRFSLASRGRPASPAEREVVADAFAHVARACARAPARLAHRDFQSANLMVRAGRPPGARLGMIDLQGAWLAPPEYDLVCLLRDSYVELEEPRIEALLARTRPRLPDAPEPELFAQRFDLLTLGRKAKDHARFLYAAAERGERGFLRYAPSALRAVQAAAARAAAREPVLRELAELVASLPETPCEA